MFSLVFESVLFLSGQQMQPMGCGVGWICPGPCWLCVCVCTVGTLLAVVVEVEVMTVGTTTNCVCIHLHRCTNKETTTKQTFFIGPPQDVLK